MRYSQTPLSVLAAVLFIVMSAMGCQPLPQPFQPDTARKSSNPLLNLPDRSGVVVRSVTGMPGNGGEMLAQKMAAALIERNLPAFTKAGNRASLILTGHAIAVNRGSSRTQIRLIWRVSGPDGLQTGEHVVDIATRRSAWKNSSSGLLRELAVQSAGKVAGLVQDPADLDQTADKKKRYLHVWPIDGAPESAGALLRAELETSLRSRAFRVSSRLRDDSLVIVGTVSLKPGTNGRRELSLEWWVMSPDGRELGELRQKNAVTPESLEKEWPAIARSIATGTSDGIKDLLDKIPEHALDRRSSAPADARR